MNPTFLFAVAVVLTQTPTADPTVAAAVNGEVIRLDGALRMAPK